MAEQNNSIINLGELAEPAKVLVEKVSDAVGGVFKPYQIKRVAKAEAEAEIIKAKTQIEISELQQRALNRFLLEEATKQENIESITSKAIPLLNDAAEPENIERDWMVDFFDKSRLISDDEMQELWAGVLAGEANVPGTYSKRTIHLVASLDKSDALLFTKLCSYVWDVGLLVPIVFDTKHDIYKTNEIDFISLTHLDSLGLINFDSLSGYKNNGYSKFSKIHYKNNFVTLEFPNETENSLNIGKVIFTKAGEQLAKICHPPVVDGFEEYVMSEWLMKNIKDADRIMFKGTVIENSISNKEILKKLRINKTWEEGDWILHNVSLDEDQVEELSRSLDNGAWYIHIWKQGEEDVKVIFKDKIFDIKYTDKATWVEAVEYGKSLGIPNDQLDFPID